MLGLNMLFRLMLFMLRFLVKGFILKGMICISFRVNEREMIVGSKKFFCLVIVYVIVFLLVFCYLIMSL